jgi:acyl-CoA synthetase (AMP-forming)/AMP-acid ligase II
VRSQCVELPGRRTEQRTARSGAFGVGASVVDRGGGVVDEQPGTVELHVSIGEQMLEGLERADGTAELVTLLGVLDGPVIGVRDAAGEEVPKAFVTRRDTYPDLGGDEVLEFVAARVAPYKKIRAIEFVGVIPKSPAGKILRKKLRLREQVSR